MVSEVVEIVIFSKQTNLIFNNSQPEFVSQPEVHWPWYCPSRISFVRVILSHRSTDTAELRRPIFLRMQGGGFPLHEKANRHRVSSARSDQLPATSPQAQSLKARAPESRKPAHQRLLPGHHIFSRNPWFPFEASTKTIMHSFSLTQKSISKQLWETKVNLLQYRRLLDWWPWRSDPKQDVEQGHLRDCPS